MVEPNKKRRPVGRRWYGAGDGIRTRDIQHGKLMLYQLSYSRGRGSGFNKHGYRVKKSPV